MSKWWRRLVAHLLPLCPLCKAKLHWRHDDWGILSFCEKHGIVE